MPTRPSPGQQRASTRARQLAFVAVFDAAQNSNTLHAQAEDPDTARMSTNQQLTALCDLAKAQEGPAHYAFQLALIKMLSALVARLDQIDLSDVGGPVAYLLQEAGSLSLVTFIKSVTYPAGPRPLTENVAHACLLAARETLRRHNRVALMTEALAAALD